MRAGTTRPGARAYTTITQTDDSGAVPLAGRLVPVPVTEPEARAAAAAAQLSSTSSECNSGPL